jgi:hypothetical protein
LIKPKLNLMSPVFLRHRNRGAEVGTQVFTRYPSSVTSAEITDATIVNADISASAAIATSKLSGAVTSIAGHGLGSLATLSSVTAAEIGDGTIADADISGTAAIATSKLSGLLTAVSGHGLGSLATLSAVSTSEITDGTLTNADIAATAAIDASKIANGSVSSTEFQYLDGLTSNVQTQLDAKASAANPTFTGTISADLGSAAAPSYSFTGDSNTGVWSSAADIVNVSTAGSERLRITSNGNVGIGTTAPDAKLAVGAPAGTSFAISAVTDAAGPRGLAIYTQDYVFGSAGSNIQMGLGAGTGDTYAMIRAYKTGKTAYAPLILQDLGGNVGIGTTSPQVTLDVSGAIRTTTGQLQLTNLSKTDPNTARDWIIYNMTGGYGNSLQFWNYDTTGCSGGMCAARFTILDSGNVGIGTTSPTGSLQVNVATAPQAPALNLVAGPGASTFGDGAALTFMHSTTERGARIYERAYSTNVGELRFATGNATSGYDDRVTIASSGNVGIGTTAPGQKLSVAGVIESTTGGVKFPDGTTQTSAISLGMAACPSGFTLIGTAGRRGTFCIDTTERTAATWLSAKSTCTGLDLAEGNSFMCTHSEWYKACLAGTPTGMTGNYEWVDEMGSYSYAWTVGNSACTTIYYDTTGTSNTYRCCIR